MKKGEISHFDLGAYDAYFSKALEDYNYPEEKIAESLKKLPQPLPLPATTC